MSFFFNQQAKKKARQSKRNVGPPGSSRASKETLQRFGCRACPLDKADVCTPKMQPTLAHKTDIYFLGEAPEKYDDEGSGKPLTGPSGELLRSLIPKDRKLTCSFDNLVRDRPKGGQPPTWVEVECCRNHVIKSIEEAKPKIVVGLGALVQSWAVGSADLVGMRGRFFAVKFGSHACWFVPTYHPQFLMDKAFDADKPLRSKFGHAFRMDVLKAFDLSRHLKPPVIDTPDSLRAGIQCFDGRGAGQLPALLTLLSEALKAPEKAIDLETNGLRPYRVGAKILTAAISFDDTHFSFAIDHPKAGWSKADRHKILELFHAVVADRKTIKIAHNVPFEVEWLLFYFGHSMADHASWECTMMQAHFIDERRGGREGDEFRAGYQKLDFLYKLYFGIAYKGLFKLDKKNMENSDLGETLVYNGVDTKSTLRLFRKQAGILKKEGLLDAYYEALPRQVSVALMQSIGINVDQHEVKSLQAKLKGEIDGIRTQIFETKVVKAFVQDHKVFNPDSQPEVLALFRDYLKMGDQLEVKEKHSGKTRFSVDKNVLDHVDHPLAKMITQWRNRNKLRSTYVDPFELGKGTFVWPDGKIHTSFNTTFAETGRTSSDEPNQQNWPSRNDKEVRKQINAPKKHVIIAVDYGQLEACTSGMCTKDKVLVKALWEDYDIHMEWSHKLVDVYPTIIGGRKFAQDKDVMKKLRSKVKNKLVFPAIFGAQDKSIAGYLDMPLEPIEKLMKEFWRTFHGLYEWQNKLMKQYYDI
ncbi:MAG TPA: DNA polymerase, partial [Anaerovoracaceae bacterium]|nr:DNA polymerase [Anaerovoracaceae bacterium]